MGYNTTIVIYNDALGDIRKDPKFGQNLADAVAKIISAPSGETIDLPAGSHCNAGMVVETHHADETALVTIGGNLGISHFSEFGWDHHRREGQMRLLRAWADKLGFDMIPRNPSK